MGRSVSLAVSMMAIWLLWSGHYTSLIITFGALSCLLVVFIARRMHLADPEGHPTHLLPRLLLYIPWLSWAILRANMDVALRILKPGLPISPRMVKVKASQKTHLGMVAYANSITLTPGTVSVDLREDGEITVHALTLEAAEDLQAGVMDRRVVRLEGE
ncbi:MAG: Na+/H+ antiporter subunit E [Candidatus Latescibacterota bacterium]|nr:Na+/H+ antiporter subunit E [Candidatus Latescibacterota bacterium]MEE2832285.1 Na+/H+ antiporter subunit E [Candidatus Latescibacterota bacterium]